MKKQKYGMMIKKANKLISLSQKYGFGNINIKNNNYFMFICEKK